MTATEQGTTINITGSTLTWVGGAGATTYPTGNAGNFNHFVGGIIKVWDGADATKYRAYTIVQASGTTSASLQAGVTVNGYIHSDGAQANYEIWLPYNFAGGDDGYTPINVYDLPANTWGSRANMVVKDFFGTDSNPYRGSWYTPDGDNWTKRTAVIYTTLNVYCDTNYLNTNDANDYLHQQVRYDYTGVKFRDGTDISSGIPIGANQMVTTDWASGYYSYDGGLTWCRSAKNNNSIRNNFQHSGGFDEQPPWYERKFLKWETDRWWMNSNGDGSVLDRWDDTDAFFAEYQAETWVDTGITDSSDAGMMTAFGVMDYNVNQVWSLDTIYTSCPRFNNVGSVDRTIQFIAWGNYADGFFTEHAHNGLRWNHLGLYGSVNLPQVAPNASNNFESYTDMVRWVLSDDGTEVYIAMGMGTSDNSDDSADLVSFNEVRIIIKGTPK